MKSLLSFSCPDYPSRRQCPLLPKSIHYKYIHLHILWCLSVSHKWDTISIFYFFTQFIWVIISYSVCSISFLKSGKSCIVYDRSSFSQFLTVDFQSHNSLFMCTCVCWIKFFFVNVPDQWMYAFLMLAILLNCFPQRFMNLYYCQQLICVFSNQYYNNLKINLK